MHTTLVLASGSAFRRDLLSRLQLPFICHSPDIDETPLLHEQAPCLVERLARLKALALKEHYSNHIIIGSDQVASFNEAILGKPNSLKQAAQQLSTFSGHTVTFYTGMYLYHTGTSEHRYFLYRCHVQFRCLHQQEIYNYLKLEQPFDCAGSFKSEGLGITLFEQIHSDDPTGLVGLSLIQLNRGLIELGYNPLLQLQTE